MKFEKDEDTCGIFNSSREGNRLVIKTSVFPRFALETMNCRSQKNGYLLRFSAITEHIQFQPHAIKFLTFT